MKTAVILHGLPMKEEYYDPKEPAQSNSHWLPWLQKQLLVRDILAQAPEMPRPYAPDYVAWKHALELFKPDAETILVAHSCGGGFLVRWLSETQIKVGKVVLVAPWLDPDNELQSDFFNFTISPELVAKTDGLTIFYSDNDEASIGQSIDKIKAIVPQGIIYKEFHNYGHFCLENMGTVEFPELLAALTEQA
jgi:uncharacterized protein